VVLPSLCLATVAIIFVIDGGYELLPSFVPLVVFLLMYFWLSFMMKRADMASFAERLRYCTQCNHAFTLPPPDPDAGLKNLGRRLKRFFVQLYYRDSRRKDSQRRDRETN